MIGKKSGGCNCNDGDGPGGGKAAAKRRARRCPPVPVRVPAGTDLALATRLYGADFLWADVEPDGSMALLFPGRAS